MTKQLEMKLPMWGGKRKGAGRKPKGSRAGVPHVARKLPSRSPAHVTVKLAPGLPSLRSSRRFSVVRRALAAAKERFGFRIIHFTVQGNHLHLLVAPAGGDGDPTRACNDPVPTAGLVLLSAAIFQL